MCVCVCVCVCVWSQEARRQLSSLGAESDRKTNGDYQTDEKQHILYELIQYETVCIFSNDVFHTVGMVLKIQQLVIKRQQKIDTVMLLTTSYNIH